MPFEHPQDSRDRQSSSKNPKVRDITIITLLCTIIIIDSLWHIFNNPAAKKVSWFAFSSYKQRPHWYIFDTAIYFNFFLLSLILYICLKDQSRLIKLCLFLFTCLQGFQIIDYWLFHNAISSLTEVAIIGAAYSLFVIFYHKEKNV